MSDIERNPRNDGQSDNWGFLEDMASIGKLDMVLGDIEESTPLPDETLPEATPDQE